MKFFLQFYIVSLLMLLTGKVYAQPSDDSIAVRVFADRGLNPDNVPFNSMLLIPQLYQANKTDTLNAVIRHWEHTGQLPEPLFSYFIIDKIKNSTFQERLYLSDIDINIKGHGVDYYKMHIIPYMHKYLYGCNIEGNARRYFHYDTSAYVITVYSRYYAFLESLAQPICNRGDLTSVEDLLIHFYACPDTNRFNDLKSHVYKGSLIRDAEMHKGMYSKNNMVNVQNIRGIHSEWNTGAWVYQGNISEVQSNAQPTLGFLFGGRRNKLTYDVDCDLYWGNQQQSFGVLRNDSLYTARYQGGGYLGIDLGYQLYRNNKSEVDALLGVEYAVFDAGYDSEKTESFHSPDINIGLGYKYYFRHRCFDDREVFNYVGIQAKYHTLYYNNAGGTDISGNAFSVTLALGAYFKDNVGFGDVASGMRKGIIKTLLRRY